MGKMGVSIYLKGDYGQFYLTQAAKKTKPNEANS